MSLSLLVGMGQLAAALVLYPQDTIAGTAQPTEPSIASFSSSDGTGGWSVDVFAPPDYANPLPDGRYPRFYVARMNRGQETNSDLRDVLWADSRACPKLLGVLSALNDLSAPRFAMGNLFGLPPVGYEGPVPKPVPMDSRGYSVEGRALQADGSLAVMRLSDTNGLVASWVIFASSQLEDCWTGARPNWLQRP